MSLDKVKHLVHNAAIYIPFNCEGIRIETFDANMFYGVGEESGEEYEFKWLDVDLTHDMFYKLVLMENN
jgi:hypothetical protein